MKIVVLSSGLQSEYGGSAISEASLCASLSREAEVIVLCPKDRWDPAFSQRFGLKGIRGFAPHEPLNALGSPLHWLHEALAGADIFHLNGHWRWENYFFTRLCLAKGIPYVMHPRGMFLLGHRKVALKHVFNWLLGDEMARQAARVIALSRYETRQFRYYPISPERIAVIPNGITVPSAFRRPEGSEPYLLYLGRLEARKNLVFLIEAFADYARGGGPCRLDLVGPIEKGYDRQILDACERYRMLGRVRILPPVYDDKKWEMMAAAKAVLYPTVDEPFGRVPFEAVAAGAYPIVPDESGSAEYLAKFLPECIYRHQNPASLVNAIRAVEARTADARELQDARAWVVRELEWGRVAGKVLALYESVTGRPRLSLTGR